MTVTEAEFRRTIDEIGPKQTEMTEGINSCISKFNGHDFGCWANTFSSGTQERIAEALTNLSQMWSDFVVEFTKLASPGWPFWFLDSADDWLDVKRDLTGQQAFLSSGAAIALPATQSWDSPDARTYKAMPGVQNAAISGVAGNAGSLADHLQGHGMQIIDLWFELGMTFVDYIQLAGKSVARFISADPTKWLDIVSEIVGVVNDVIDFVQGILRLIKDQWTATKNAMYGLDSAFADVSGSVAGAWPTPANLSE